MSDDEIKEILKNSKTIAMIGVSSEKKGEDPKNLKRKPANVVMKYMQDFGYKVIPVNPFAEGEIINGEKVISSLEKISESIDIVDKEVITEVTEEQKTERKATLEESVFNQNLPKQLMKIYKCLLI